MGIMWGDIKRAGVKALAGNNANDNIAVSISLGGVLDCIFVRGPHSRLGEANSNPKERWLSAWYRQFSLLGQSDC